ncbi:hypothetical protein Tco_0697475 [Tanacetum coccineum]
MPPRFVGPFEITKRIGPVAYRLRLPQELYSVHDTFHVSNLKKCLADPTLQIPLEEIQVDAKLNFVEELVEILEREIKKLKRSRILIVKVKQMLSDCQVSRLFADLRSSPKDPFYRDCILGVYLCYVMDHLDTYHSDSEELFCNNFRPHVIIVWLSRQEDNEEATWCEHYGGGSSNHVALDVAGEEVEEGQRASIFAATGISDLEQKTFTRSKIKWLTALLHSRSNESSSADVVERDG